MLGYHHNHHHYHQQQHYLLHCHHLILHLLSMGEASRDFIRRLVGCQELSESEIHIALTAAGVDELVPDGNRKLSQLGLGATGFLLDFSCALMALSRGKDCPIHYVPYYINNLEILRRSSSSESTAFNTAQI